MLNYKAIEIFTNEAVRYQGQPLAEAVVEYVRRLKIAARCIVTRGIAGCDESGETTTMRLEVLSYNLPVRIYIVLPAAETDRVLEKLSTMVVEGIVAVHELAVISHRTRNAFFPRKLLVRDVMTAPARSVGADSSLRQAARILLSAVFTGLPVVDQRNRPVGVISQGDLIARGGLPLRLGLLVETGSNECETILQKLANRRAEEVMSRPAVVIAADRPLAEAVEKMLAKKVKRLPVVDRDGHLTGILSRIDIFRTVMRAAPDWKAFQEQKIEVRDLKRVGDILRRDTHTVAPDASVAEVIQVIDRDDIQRVAVVDGDGKLLGMISDRNLLHYFKPRQSGIWSLLSRMKPSAAQDACGDNLHACLSDTRAADVMITDLITVGEDALIEEAVALMTANALKRLPVVDEKGRFKGMLSRNALLHAGFEKVDKDCDHALV